MVEFLNNTLEIEERETESASLNHQLGGVYQSGSNSELYMVIHDSFGRFRFLHLASCIVMEEVYMTLDELNKANPYDVAVKAKFVVFR